MISNSHIPDETSENENIVSGWKSHHHQRQHSHVFHQYIHHLIVQMITHDKRSRFV